MADYTLVTTPNAGHALKGLRETKTALETISAAMGGVLLTKRVVVDLAGEAVVTPAAVPATRSGLSTTDSN